MFLMNLTWSKTVLDFKVSKSESLVNCVSVSDWLFHPMSVAAESAVVLGGCAVMSSDVKQMLPYADYPPIDSSKTLVRISKRQRVVKQLVMRCVSNNIPMPDILAYLVVAVRDWERASMSKRTFERLMLDSRRAIKEQLGMGDFGVNNDAVPDQPVPILSRESESG